MEFLGNFGVDIKLLIAQIINFGLLLWILSRFLYRPIIKRIEKDEIELKQAQTQKSELIKEKNAFEEQKKKEIADAKQRSREIINEAEQIAKEIRNRAKQEVDKEKQAVIKQIKSRLAEIEHEQESKE